MVNQIFLVHGEYDEQQPFGERLRRKGFKDVIIPNIHETYSIE